MNFLRQFRAAPNLLTLLRLFIIPFLVIEILDGRFRLAFALFLLAGISDAFDGILARWLSQHTRLGQYLDPIADKLLLSTLFLVFTHVGMVPRYVTVLVFSRDLGILLIATLLFATGTLRDFRPSLLGKLNTLVQIVALTVLMVAKIAPSWEPRDALRDTDACNRYPGPGLRRPVRVDRVPASEHAGAGGLIDRLAES